MIIYSIGIGPGNSEFLTPQASKALQNADIIVGYSYYIELIKEITKGKETIATGMKKEQDRANKAFEMAQKNYNVAVISSGDSGVYGMAALLWETKINNNIDIEIEVIPGISAMFVAAARFGAPLGHDFCSVSLSNLLTPWDHIEKRIIAAAQGDFVTAVYNPSSKGRFWQLMRFKELFLTCRSPETPVGIAKNAGREDEKLVVTKLKNIDTSMVDMFSIIIVGNSQTKSFKDKLITPRGYFPEEAHSDDKIGRKIMNQSFKKILPHIEPEKNSLEHNWLALHCIHTTADFSLNNLLEINGDIVSKLHKALYSENPPAIITDVSMVTKGFRKTIIEKLGITVKCYLNDERIKDIAEREQITRTQAGIRLAVKEYPNAIFVFGNAPTALMELVKYVKSSKANPLGVIAAPVGFVNVRESKWQVKYGCPDIPQVIISGNKGGSSIAATIINAILSWDEADQIHPGEGI